MSASSEEQQGAAMSPVGGEADPSSAGVVRVVVRRREYHDPVTLMEASEAARSVAGVDHVAVAMAEPLNMLILGQRHGYEVGADGLGADDVVIALRASDEAAADEALAVIERWLDEHGAARRVIDVGPYVFAGGEAVERMRFRVAEAGDELPAGLAARAEAIARANDEAVGRMQEARPLVVGVATAADVLPGMGPRTFLHAGPPIEWADMSGPLRGAIIGAALLEGVADDPDDAVRRAQAGEFEFAPGHERGALGPMAGVIGPSMPVWVVENETHGNRAHCTFSEALAGFRFGAFGPEVVERLRWLRGVLAPVVRSALERLPAPLDLRAITAQAVQMGDEVHNLNRAGTAEVFRALAPAFMEVDAPSNDVSDVARYIAEDLFFYLNLSMASGKATADAASGIEDSTIVTTIARNGTEVGVRMSGTGERWFTAPSSTIRGLYFPGYGREDANPRHGRQHDHRDDRARRLCDGRRPRDRPCRGHHRRGRVARHAEHVRDHLGGERQLPHPRAGLSRHPGRDRLPQGGQHRHRPRRQHRHRPPPARAWASSAAASSRRRSRPLLAPSTPSASKPRRASRTGGRNDSRGDAQLR